MNRRKTQAATSIHETTDALSIPPIFTVQLEEKIAPESFYLLRYTSYIP